MASLVRFERVTCRYGRDPVLVNVDFEIGEGEFIGVVGPSGSGKSTLLRAIAGSVEPIAGRIDRDPGLSIGYVPQVETVNWFFPVTVREAILMARIDGRRLPWPSKQEVAEAQEVLERLGLGGLADRHIRELSGGQQQRVFIARAMLGRPRLLLLDEPTSGVAVDEKFAVMDTVMSAVHDSGAASLFVEHDMEIVARYASRVVAFYEGRILADGPTAEVLDDAEVRKYVIGAELHRRA